MLSSKVGAPICALVGHRVKVAREETSRRRVHEIRGRVLDQRQVEHLELIVRV